jgi:hypothetical protein
MERELRLRADDLLESLLVCELEMRRSRTLEKKLEAFQDFGRIVVRIDALRRDVEERHADDDFLRPLERKVTAMMRSAPYRIAEWFHTGCQVRWFIAAGSLDPAWNEAPC